jgi:phytoene desaturase
MHAVPVAMAAAAAKHGVSFRYNTEVASVEVHGDRASAVITKDGERIEADVVVLNPDLPIAYRDLLGYEPWSIRRLTYSLMRRPVGRIDSPLQPDRSPQHPLRSFLKGVFKELIDDQQIMSDPSFCHQLNTLRPAACPGRARELLRPVPTEQSIRD